MKMLTWRMVAACILLALCNAQANAAEIIDDRITLVPSGMSTVQRQVLFAGQAAVIQGAAINGSSGGTLFNAPARILDAASGEGVDFVLTESSLLMVKGKKVAAMPLGGVFSGGRLLFARPDFFVYYLTNPEGTLFFTRSLTETQLYFVADKEFVAARLDEDANTVIATRSKLFSVDMNGRVSPLYDLKEPVIEGMEILTADNTVLLDTPANLLKVTPGGSFYTVLAGRGSLLRAGDKYFWYDAAEGRSYMLQGLELLGHPESDQPYARSLLQRGRKLIALEQYEPAFKSFLHLLEMMPDDPEARQLVLALGGKLYAKK